MTTKTAKAPVLELVELDYDLVAPHPDNIRKDLGDLSELTASIKSKGILEPCLVLPPDEDGIHLLVAGERRWTAAGRAKLAKVPCVLRDMELADVLEAMLIENLHRQSITPIEEARGYARLVELGTTVAQLAKKVGKAQATVKARLALLQLDDRLLHHITQGNLTLNDAADLVPYADDDEAMSHIAHRLGMGKVAHPASDLATHVKERDQKAAMADAVAKLSKAGTARYVADGYGGHWYKPSALNTLSRPAPVTVLGFVEGGARRHQAEPCHAVYLELTPGQPGPIYKVERTTVCVDPLRHSDRGPEANRSDVQIPADKLPPLPGATRVAEEDPEAIARREAAAAAKQARTLFCLVLVAETETLPLDDFTAWILFELIDNNGNITDVVRMLPDLPGVRPADLDDYEDAWDFFHGLERAGRSAGWDRWILASMLLEGEEMSHARAGSRTYVTYIRHLIASGYEPTPWDLETLELADAEAERAKVPDVDAMELDTDTAALLALWHHLGRDFTKASSELDDHVADDLDARGFIVETDGVAILTDAGAAVAAVLAERAKAEPAGDADADA
ncbi:MAG: hypothetical protein JWM89_1823 [Acidimicrobiales bacterium]|nr:hypothetical protein [Acidimicrobiales bacterium]